MIAPEEIINKVRTTYGRTIDEILAKEHERDLYDILGAVQVLVGSKIYQKLPTTLGERMVFAFSWMAIEVRNGTFHQYFFNSAGDFWRDVLDGLVLIGDQRGATRFHEVLSIFPDAAPSMDRCERQEQLSKLDEQDETRCSEHFDRTAKEYYREPFPNWELVYDYIRSHKSDFDLRTA